MTIEDDIAFLARVPTFAQFGYAALQIVAIGSETRHLADGETLFQAGQTADAGYVIQEGSLALITGDPKLPEAAVTLGPGTLIGELALVTETVYAATTIAAEPTVAIRISRNLFRKVLEGFPGAARLMRDRVAALANQSNSELVRIRAMLEQQPPKGPALASPPGRSLPGDVHSASSRGRPGRPRG